MCHSHCQDSPNFHEIHEVHYLVGYADCCGSGFDSIYYRMTDVSVAVVAGDVNRFAMTDMHFRCPENNLPRITDRRSIPSKFSWTNNCFSVNRLKNKKKKKIKRQHKHNGKSYWNRGLFIEFFLYRNWWRRLKGRAEEGSYIYCKRAYRYFSDSSPNQVICVTLIVCGMTYDSRIPFIKIHSFQILTFSST